MTFEQKRIACEKFLAWLRKHFPAKGAEIKVTYRNVRQLKANGVAAFMYVYGSVYKIEIATDQDIFHVLGSVAHEYEHVRQMVNERLPIEKLRGKKEIAAWGFSMYSLNIYKKEVKEVWV